MDDDDDDSLWGRWNPPRGHLAEAPSRHDKGCRARSGEAEARERLRSGKERPSLSLSVYLSFGNRG